MKDNNIKIIFSLSILTSILTVGAFIFIFNIVRNKNEHTSAVLTTLENKISDKNDRSLLEKKVSQVESVHNTIDNYLVDPSKAELFVDYIENLGIKTKADVTVTGVDVPVDKPHIINMNVTVKGKFENVMQAINILEVIPYKINIDHIYLNKQENPSTQDPLKKKIVEVTTWQADITFSVASS